MPNKPYPLGGKPHRKDERNWLFREASIPRLADSAAPPTAGPTDDRWYAMHGADFRIDQLDEGTCVGHALTNHFLASPRPHWKFPDFATVEDAHQFARDAYFGITGDATYQQGAYMDDACAYAVQKNYCSAYYRCASVDEVVQALLAVSPVFWASPWYYSCYYEDGPLRKETGEYYMKVNPASELAGFHAYLLTGVDISPPVGPPFVRMQNSWGPGWGKNGTARITIDDLNVLYDGDAWVLTENVF